MPNIKSAIKRVQVSQALCARNKSAKSALKTSIRKFDAAVTAGDKTAAQAAYRVAVSSVDKAACDKIIHKNNAAHKKSALASKLNAMAE